MVSSPRGFGSGARSESLAAKQLARNVAVGGSEPWPAPRRRCCCGGCRARAHACRERSVRGFRLPQLLGLLATLSLPIADAWLDWGVATS